MFTVRKQIYGGFALLILLVAGLGIFGSLRFQAGEASVGLLARLSEGEARSLIIARDVEISGRATERLIQSGEPDALRRLMGADQEAERLIAEAIDKSLTPVRRARYQDALALLEATKPPRDLIVRLTSDAARLAELTRSTGDRMSTALIAVTAAIAAGSDVKLLKTAFDVDHALMLARLNVARLVGAGASEDDAKAVAKYFAAAIARMSDLDSPSADSGVRDAVTAFRSGFEAYRAAVMERVAATLKRTETFSQQVQPRQADALKTIDAVLASLRIDQEAAALSAAALASRSALLEDSASVAAVLLGSLIAFALARRILGPLVAMTGAMTELANGRLEVAIPTPRARDELGAMARALSVFQRNAIDRVRVETEYHAKEARDATVKAEEMRRVADDVEREIGGIATRLRDAAGGLGASAGAMSANARDATGRANSVVAASNAASDNVQMVAAASEELSSSIGEISRRVDLSARIAGQAVADARATDTMVEGLARAADRIGEVVGLIQSIASQTNLLALNATIEAARAGDAGKGFAVVASEVKNLAAQTARATEDIAGQVVAIQGATGQAVTAIRDIGATIARMNEITTEIAAAVEQQGAATREISGNVQRAAQSAEEVAGTIALVSQTSVTVERGAVDLLASADGVLEQSTRLSGELARVLAAIRAA